MATIRVSFLLGGKRFHGRLNRFSVLSDVPAKATCVNRAGPGYKVIRLRRLSHTRQYRTDQGASLRRAAGDRRTRIVSRSRKSGQDDKWNFCLITAIVAVNRRDHEQTTPPEPLTGLQGEGGTGRRQGRPNHRTAGGAFRRSP